MHRPMILCVTDDDSPTNALVATLREAGYELLTTGSMARATALLFLHRKLEAVVLDQRGNAAISLRLPRLLRSLRADIPILLLAREVVEPLPNYLDACLCVGQELTSLLPILDTLVRGGRGFNLDRCGMDHAGTGF